MSDPSPPPRSFFSRAFRIALRIAQVLAVLGLLGVIAGVFVLRAFEKTLPDVSELRANYRPPQVTRILAADGSLLSEMFIERRTIVPIASLPAHVKLAVLAAEDAGFYEHAGLNYLGMLRALVVNFRAGRTRQGGSTITQQVVKNVLLDPERTYSRKLKEVLLARRLEQDLSKDEILELYLNHIYFGGGRYGIEEAARYYFGKPAHQVTVAEAALLAGLSAGPERFSPRHDMNGALTRRAFVLGQMEEKGFLSHELAEQARAEVVRLAPAVESQATLAPEVVEIAKKTLQSAVGDGYARGGYTVYTTIDPRLQSLARKSLRENLLALDKRTKVDASFKAPDPKKKAKKGDEKAFEGVPKKDELHRSFLGVVTGTHDDLGTVDVRVGDIEGAFKLADFERYNPKHLPPSAFAEDGALVRVSFLVPPAESLGGEKSATRVPLRLEVGAESALVAIDVRTRNVLALAGSYEGALGSLDRAMQSKRQPGSTFKPILYSYALRTRKVTPATVFDASPPPGGNKQVSGDEGALVKPIRLREAVAHSVNAVAQKVMQEVGPAQVVTWAESMGITSKLGADLSLALGSYEVSPFEMAGAYATLAAGGVYETPHIITRIVDPSGKDVPLVEKTRKQRVMDEAEAYLTTSLLTSVVDHGTGMAAKSLGRPLAGKTGTTNQAKDAWFLGYSTDVVCAVWTGYDEPRPLGGGREAGATAALPAWMSFMKGAHEKKPATDFPRPIGLVDVRIDPATGLRAYDGETEAIDETFLAGSEPTQVAEIDAGVPDDAGAPDDAAAPPVAAAPSASVALPALPAPTTR